MEDHAGLGDQREESDDELKGKDAITHSLNTDHVTLTQILDPPDTPDISFQNKETIMWESTNTTELSYDPYAK